MDWNKINSLMPEVVKCVREEYIVNNTIISELPVESSTQS